jgi:probable rRNA maturation factor
LNRKYHNKNCPTDILSFSETSNNLFPKGLGSIKNINLGEIVICPQEVKENSQKINALFKEELCRVLIHGLLHLLGYSHEKSEKQAKKMREKEDEYLKILKC